MQMLMVLAKVCFCLHHKAWVVNFLSSLFLRVSMNSLDAQVFMICPKPQYFFFTPVKMLHHQAILICFLAPSYYSSFNYFCLFLAHHPSLALFFISNNSSCFFNFGCLLFSYHFMYIPSLSSLLPSNLSFIWALVLFLLASSSTFFCVTNTWTVKK